MYKKISVAICIMASFAITIQPVSFAADFPGPYITNDIRWYKKDDVTCSDSSANGVSGRQSREDLGIFT